MKQNKLFTQTNYCNGTTSTVDSVVTSNNTITLGNYTIGTSTGHLSASSGSISLSTGTGIISGSTSLSTGTGISSGNFSLLTVIDVLKGVCDETKIIIDISKRSALLKDFAGTSSYEIKKMETKIKNGEDYFVVSVERVLLPGELSLYKKTKKKEILIEFSDSLPDERDGRKWILNGVVLWDSHALFTNIFAGTIANDLVAVQPMGGPTMQSFYMDYKYGNNEEVVPYNGDRTQTTI